MRLIVIAIVVKEFAFAQALLRRFGAKDILKTYHLAERLSRVAHVILEQPAQLPWAQAGIKVFFDI